MFLTTQTDVFKYRIFLRAALAVALAATLLPSLVAESKEKPEVVPAEPAVAAPFMPPPPPVPSDISFDFTGNQRAEIGRWSPSNSGFTVYDTNANGYVTSSIGTASSKLAPGDFDGNGYVDPGVFDNGVWTYKTSPGGTAQTFTLGQAGDIPASGYFLGDDTKTDAAVFRPSNGQWLIRNSQTGAIDSTIFFGQSGDIPIAGDFDGDNITDCAIYRNGTWWVRRSSDLVQWNFVWGNSTDIPVHGDFDGDGKSDPTIFRPTDGSWYVLRSIDNHTTFNIYSWGNWADQPVPADYDGDGKADIAIWRPTTGQWYIWKSNGSGTDIHGLGNSNDVAIPSAYTKQVGGSVSGYAMANARLSPKNATGGTDYYSRNFSWGTSLVGLAGRSGMDAGIGLSYNSLVWINVDSGMFFDPDTSNVAPGFRFGPPEIEPAYFDSERKKWSYLMVTPNGSRIQFRQDKASGDYVTADSSYAVLKTKGADNPNDPPETVDLTVTTSDGTAMKFDWTLGGYRCKKVTDRNGNYITYAFDALGKLTSMTDTLGRIITVTYNGDGTPLSLTQNWNGGPHSWASFQYTTKSVSTGYNPANIYGPQNGTNVTVLDKVNYPDGSYTKFEYNGYLQVTEVKNYADNDEMLNSTAPSYAVTTTDPPKMESIAIATASFNGGGTNTVTVTNSSPSASTFNGPYGSESTVLVNVGISGHPNGLYSKLHFGPSGWKEGLNVATEDCVTAGCSPGERKRWTYNKWDQDSPGANYSINPRMIETHVGDTVSTKKTVIGYTAFEAPDTYHLPTSVNVYKIPGDTHIGQTAISYVTGAQYIDRRILRLPYNVTTSGLNSETTNLETASSTSYLYDEGDFTGTGQTITASRHNLSEYGANFIIGRGNVTTVQRNEVGGGTHTDTNIKYNVTGSPVSQKDPRERETTISYTDSFIGSPPSPTYAYPTTVTDPGGFPSTIQYRFDMGANVSASSPNGFNSTRIFDGIGRLLQQTVTGGAYTRYEYAANGRQFKTFSTITDGLGETMSESWTDGAGRTYRSRSELPNSTGGWAAVKKTYDILGRVVEQSVAAEVSVPNPNDPNSWTLAGDDQSSGWRVSATAYDWKGRVTSSMPAGATGNANTIIGYEGCGCSGGLETTIEGPMVPRDDNPSLSARRKQKLYEDPVGRTWKTETFNWDNGLYSTTINKFNGRDQVTLSTITEATTSASQVTTMSYDGYGRLITKQIPQQTGSTIYNYNPDDSIAWVKDARLAMTSYTYGTPTSTEKRKLVTNVSYSAPNGITIPGNVSFQYDSVGNRTQMMDGLGTQTYVVNSLSQITSETRQFNDSLPSAPQGNNSFQTNYSYHIGGQLKSVTEPWGVVSVYSYNKSGQLTGVAPQTQYGAFSTFAANAQYRAWGGLKHLEYGNGTAMNQTFNSTMQPDSYQLTEGQTTTLNKTYTYNGDGMLRSAVDNLNFRFHRLNTYDHQGRIKEAKSSLEAAGGTVTNGADLPYRQTYQFNAFGDMTTRNNLKWGYAEFNRSYSFTNSRISGWTYDADGRATVATSPDPYSAISYDAAGRLHLKHDIHAANVREDKIMRSYDGDGRELKRFDDDCRIVETQPPSTECTWTGNEALYYIRSTVLGGEVIAEPYAGGTKGIRYVRVGGSILAHLKENSYWTVNGWVTYDAAYFEQTDGSGMSTRVSKRQNPFGYGDYSDIRQGEFDPGSANYGLQTDYIPPYVPPNNPPIPLEDESPLYIDGQFVQATVDGVAMNWQAVRNMLASGTILPAALKNFQGMPGFSSTSNGTGSISYNIPGYFWESPDGPGYGDTVQVGSWGFMPSRSGIINFSSYSIVGFANKVRGPSAPVEKPSVNGNSNFDVCNHWLGSAYALLKSKFDEIWKKTEDSKSAKFPNGTEAGGVISIHNERVIIGGKPDVLLDLYDGPTTDMDMDVEGGDFSGWVIEKKRVRGLDGYTTLVVHTHPIGKAEPSGPGDYGWAKSKPEAVMNATEIGVYDGKGKVICKIRR